MRFYHLLTIAARTSNQNETPKPEPEPEAELEPEPEPTTTMREVSALRNTVFSV